MGGLGFTPQKSQKNYLEKQEKIRKRCGHPLGPNEKRPALQVGPGRRNRKDRLITTTEARLDDEAAGGLKNEGL